MGKPFEHVGLEPRSASAWRYRGAAKHNLGDQPGAITDLDRALELDPRSVWAWRNRGAAKGVLGDSRGAIADFDRALELMAPHDPARTRTERLRSEARRRLAEQQ